MGFVRRAMLHRMVFPNSSVSLRPIVCPSASPVSSHHKQLLRCTLLPKRFRCSQSASHNSKALNETVSPNHVFAAEKPSSFSLFRSVFVVSKEELEQENDEIMRTFWRWLTVLVGSSALLCFSDIMKSKDARRSFNVVENNYAFLRSMADEAVSLQCTPSLRRGALRTLRRFSRGPEYRDDFLDGDMAECLFSGLHAVALKWHKSRYVLSRGARRFRGSADGEESDDAAENESEEETASEDPRGEIMRSRMVLAYEDRLSKGPGAFASPTYSDDCEIARLIMMVLSDLARNEEFREAIFKKEYFNDVFFFLGSPAEEGALCFLNALTYSTPSPSGRTAVAHNYLVDTLCKDTLKLRQLSRALSISAVEKHTRSVSLILQLFNNMRKQGNLAPLWSAGAAPALRDVVTNLNNSELQSIAIDFVTAVIARQPPNYEPGDAEVDSVFYIVAKVDQLRSVTPSVIDVTSDLLAMLETRPHWAEGFRRRYSESGITFKNSDIAYAIHSIVDPKY